MVRDGNIQYRFPGTLSSERSRSVFHSNRHRLADKFLGIILDKSARKKLRLDKHLESVTNPKNSAARLGEPNHIFHDRGKLGNGSRTQVIPIGKPTRQNDEIEPGKVHITLVPYPFRMQLEDVLEDMETIVIAIGTGKNNYAAIHKSVGKIISR